MPTSIQGDRGQRIACHRFEGGNPGVIFCGGFNSDMSGTKAMALEHWCRERGQAFVRFDYFGHGDSEGRLEQGSIGHWAADTIAVVDQLSTGPQVLVGSSMGAWLMILAALARAERIAGLVGIASAPDFTEDLLQPGLSTEQLQQLRDDGLVFIPSRYDDGPYPVSRHLLEEGKQHLILRAEIALHCPVRLLHGMNDPDVPWQTSTRLAECLQSRDVLLTLIKDGEHRLSRETDLALLFGCLASLIDH